MSMDVSRSRTQAESTLTQTLQKLMESKKVQMLLALVLVLVAIRLYFPPEAAPDAALVNSKTAAQPTVTHALTAVTQYQNSLEKQLEAHLSKIAGAGQVSVMLTLASTNDAQIAINTQHTSRNTEEKDGAGTTKVTSEQTYSSQPVMARGTGGDGVVKLKENMPQINGIVVIATGAKDPRVEQLLTHAAQTILSLPAHRVRVFPGK